MKLATYHRDGADRAALVVGDLVFDMVETQKVVNALPGPTRQQINAGKPLPGSILDLVRAGPAVLDETRRLYDFLQMFVDHPGDMRLFRRVAHPAATVHWRP